MRATVTTAVRGTMNAMPWADPHCHLYDDRIRPLTQALTDAFDAGVHRLITVGCDLATTDAAIRDAAEGAAAGFDVWATAGVHPHEASHGWEFLTERLERRSELRLVAVGECGLDFFYDHSPRDEQRRSFAAQIGLAHTFDLPLVIHTRDAWDDTFEVLSSEGVPASTVFHCFTGGPAEAERCLSLAEGVVLSYSGIATFPSAQSLRDAAAITPLDRLTVETDAPYLAPVPFRGRANRPAYVPHVGATIAAVHGVDVSVVADATWATVARAYRLPC